MAKTEWTGNVKPVSMEDLDRLGVDNETGDLFWDGQMIQRRTVRLETFERIVAGLVALATIGATVIAALEYFWPNVP